MTIRTLLIGLAALSIAGCSAYFSIIGLSTLFAGASTVIMVMAASMEFSKLVTASFLYMYWSKLGKLMKTYLSTALLVLVVITSMGIYGFLTAAFQTTSEELAIVERQIENVETRKSRFQSQIENDRQDREVMNETVTQLTEGLSTGNVVQYVDPETGQLVTSTSSAQRNILRDQLERAQDERDRLSDRISAYSDSVSVYESRILDLQSETDISSELGPLQFVAEVLGIPMVQVVNAIALLIMFSFDPLAIALVIAFNMSIYFHNKDKFDELLDSDTNTDDEDGHPDDELDVEDSPPQSFDIDEVSERYDNISKNIRESSTEDLYAEDEPIKVEDDDTGVDNIKKTVDKIINSDPTLTDEDDSVENDDDDDGKQEPTRDKKSILNNLTQKQTAVKYERDGKTVGYDTSKNGRVDKWSSSGMYRKYRGHTPYYMKGSHNWNDLSSWIDDQAAVNYWITNIKNSSNYPTNFSEKIY